MTATILLAAATEAAETYAAAAAEDRIRRREAVEHNLRIHAVRQIRALIGPDLSDQIDVEDAVALWEPIRSEHGVTRGLVGEVDGVPLAIVGGAPSLVVGRMAEIGDPADGTVRLFVEAGPVRALADLPELLETLDRQIELDRQALDRQTIADEPGYPDGVDPIIDAVAEAAGLLAGALDRLLEEGRP